MLRKYDRSRTELPPGATTGIISLGNSHWAMVDAADYPEISKCRWTWKRSRHCIYAVRKVHVNGHEYLLRMHRIITECPVGMDCHHSNGNSLDNRRCNLVNLTPDQHRQIHNIFPTLSTTADVI